MLHKHHKIPKHAGGPNDASNIVRLKIEEHAEAHRLLFEQYGRWQDEIAWKAISGQIGKEEILFIKSSQGGQSARDMQVGIFNPDKKHLYRQMGGKAQGKINAESGHMKEIQKKGCANGIGGKVQGKQISVCPHCGKEGKGIAMRRWHMDNCKKLVKTL